MAWSVTADTDRFDEAFRFFASRTLVTAEDARLLTARAKVDAFWVGAGLELAQVQRVFDSLNEAQGSGASFEDWRQQVRDELSDDVHAETVFRNATQRALNAGRYYQATHPDVLEGRPFWMFDAVLDSRTTEICEQANGTILPAQDPWFLRNWPPRHHRCRSGVRTLTQRQAEARGISVSAPETDAEPGFGATPGTPESDEAIRPRPDKTDAPIFQELERKRADDEERRRPPLVRVGDTAAKALQAGAIETRGLARQAIRAQIAEDLPGSLLNDLARNNSIRVATPKLGRARANGAHSFVDGSVDITGTIQRDGADALRALAAGTPTTQEQVVGLRTLLHQELHGHSRSSQKSYRGIGKVLEEIGTELNARRIVAGLTGGRFAELTGPYSGYIEPAADAVAQVLGRTRAEAIEIIADAHWRGVMMAEKEFGSPEDHLDALSDALDVTQEERRLIKTLISLITA